MIEFPIAELPCDRGYWYLATLYSIWPYGLDDANTVAQKLAARLMEEHIPTFSPIAHTHGIATHVTKFDKRDHDFWMAHDKPLVDAACGLLVADLPRWRESKGVGMEIHWFGEAKKPIWLLNTTTLAFRALRM